MDKRGSIGDGIGWIAVTISVIIVLGVFSIAFSAIFLTKGKITFDVNIVSTANEDYLTTLKLINFLTKENREIIVNQKERRESIVDIFLESVDDGRCYTLCVEGIDNYESPSCKGKSSKCNEDNSGYLKVAKAFFIYDSDPKIIEDEKNILVKLVSNSVT